MYNSFFGFKENPFNLTPDPRYLFLSDHHKEALEHLLYGINERKGFIVITGGIGTGKTTLCRVLLEHLAPDTKSALVFNSFISAMELLQNINQEFGVNTDSQVISKKGYIDLLNQFLLENFSKGGNAMLLIDEAQNLSPEVLEQIRMLSNLETTREKLIQIILVGQPELNEILESPSIRQLNERVMVRYNLKALVYKDIMKYVDHRLVVAGGRGNLSFTKSAFRQIYSYSKGNPRRINTLCDRTLLIAYAKEKRTVSRGIIKKAVMELGGNPLTGYSTSWPLMRYVSYSLLLLLLIVAAGVGGWSISVRGIKFDPAHEGVAVANVEPPRLKKPVPERKPVSLFLNEQESLSRLFTLFYNNISDEIDSASLNLMKFELDPEYYVMLKRPFQVKLDESASTEGFLLVIETRPDGAVAVDSEGNEQTVSRDFIYKHWGGITSWVFPNIYKDPILLVGMHTREVTQLQNNLKKIGYMVKTTGEYDSLTFREVTRFQRDFGLLADGVAGPRTRALLYQMVD